MMLPDQQIRERLKDKVVGIAGCGGLGSNCAVALARVGIGKLVIADFDCVELSNLNRQYFFRDQLGENKALALQQIIHRIDPAVVVEPHDVLLGPDNVPALFGECDLIVEAFDKAAMKQMLIETVSEKMKGKVLVCGVGLAGWGKSESIALQKFGDIYLCGDGEMEVSENLPPLAPRVGMVANMQANTVLEILLGRMQ